MNIEIADRLCELRKNSKLSQEQLAEKLGISRQAVSKWERGEASPDTDNLIALADVYDVSIDEILTGKSRAGSNDNSDDSGGADSCTDNSNDSSFNNSTCDTDTAENNAQSNGYKKSKFSFKNGINVNEDNEYVHVGFDGIHVEDKNGTRVHIDAGGVFVEENGERKAYTDEHGHIFYKDNDYKSYKDDEPCALGVIKNICIPIVAIIAFLIWGFCFSGWYIAWLVFLGIPVVCSLIDAVAKRKPSHFAYPVLVVIAYLIGGLQFGVWHPTWVIFLTIPVFYGICEAFKKIKK